MEWDYTITGAGGREIAVISKELFHMTDTYVLDIADPENALYVLMFVLAIDAERSAPEISINNDRRIDLILERLGKIGKIRK